MTVPVRAVVVLTIFIKDVRIQATLGVRWVSTVVLGSMQEVQGRERELWLTVGRISTCPHINSYYYWIRHINLF